MEPSVIQLLNLVGVVTANLKSATFSNTLRFVGTVTTNQKIAVTSNTLGFASSTLYGTPVKSAAISQTLTFTQSVVKPVNGSASNYLSFYHNASALIIPVNQTLNFTQTVEVLRYRGGRNTLTFTNTITTQSVLARPLTQTLNFESAANAFICNNCLIIGNYSVNHGTVTLSYGSLTVTLVNPEFNNSENFDYSNIVRRSRGGSLQIGDLPLWPDITTLSYTISGFKDAQYDQLRAFLKASLGKVVTLVDFENVTWEGLILNPDSAISEVGRNNYSATFEMEMEKT